MKLNLERRLTQGRPSGGAPAARAVGAAGSRRRLAQLTASAGTQQSAQPEPGAGVVFGSEWND